MYRWKKRSIRLPAAIAAIVFVGILIALSSRPNEINFFQQAISDLSTAGFVEVKPGAAVVDDRGVVSLTGGCYQMTANTEVAQAESIANGINRITGERPNTHDLAKDAFENLKIEVLMVKIVELRNTSTGNTFYGRLILKNGDKIANLDSRPSDGIAIAVRTGSPIYIKEDLLRQQGNYIC